MVNFFTVGEVVGHEDDTCGDATIESFTLLVNENEIRVETDKGFARLDFIVKIDKKNVTFCKFARLFI